MRFIRRYLIVARVNSFCLIVICNLGEFMCVHAEMAKGQRVNAILNRVFSFSSFPGRAGHVAESHKAL